MSLALNLRIGNGIDFHRFGIDEGDFEIKLGGVSVPSSKKLIAHSDGDVVLHAICDCIFGAISNGNIGTHFPNTDPKWENANSEIFINYAMDLLESKGGKIVNLDCTVVCEMPKVMPFAELIKQNIARITKLEAGRIGIKAVTTEKMGFLGRGDGISALCTALFVID